MTGCVLMHEKRKPGKIVTDCKKNVYFYNILFGRHSRRRTINIEKSVILECAIIGFPIIAGDRAR